MHTELAKPLSFVWLLATLAFILYGSLVPLDFHPHSLAWAWEKFQQTPMLNLGIDSRADWIANGVLYLPAGFLLAVFRAPKRVHCSAVANQARFRDAGTIRAPDPQPLHRRNGPQKTKSPPRRAGL